MTADRDDREAGVLDAVDGRLRLTYARPVAVSPERAWRALTEPADLAVWFPARIDGERVTGAPLRFTFPGQIALSDEAEALEGEMLVVDPPTLLVFRWEDETLRFDLRPAADGAVLTFATIFDEIGRAARDAAGWHVCLDVLAHHLAEIAPPWTPAERWAQVHPGYVARLGPEAATIGPPGADD